MSPPALITRLTKPQPYFNYTPLPDGWIRLITIVDDLSMIDSNFERPIHITITSLPLETAPEYIAVSYTWDSPTYEVDPTLEVFCREPRCYPIFAQGKILLGTRNLRDMLREIRQARATQPYTPEAAKYSVVDAGRYYWIDALSIDQDDLQERAAQVAIIGSIYKQSRACVVWLGPEDGYARSAFNFAVQVHSNKSLHSYLIGPKKDIFKFRQEFVRILGTLSKDQVIAIAKLFSRRYFSRLWIIPEIILARSIVVLCGSLMIQMNALLTFAWMLAAADDVSFWPRAEQFAKERNLDLEGLHPIHITYIVLANLYPWKQLNPHGKLPDLKTILEMTAASEAKEPHDRIYAIMSVVEEFMQQGKPIMEANYMLPVAKVFMNATTAVATNMKSLEILFRVCRPSENYPELPSWCPDFSTCGRAILNIRGSNNGTWHTGQLWTEPPVFTFSGQSLTVDGFRFDTVSEVVQLQRGDMNLLEDKLTPPFENWGSSHLELAARLDWSSLAYAPYQLVGHAT
jgi:Heterokaryon incompatibility protein (HET)